MAQPLLTPEEYKELVLAMARLTAKDYDSRSDVDEDAIEEIRNLIFLARQEPNSQV